MWNYEKRLQYPVNITRPNAKIAKIIMSQYGGPDGEMGASMRYLSQRYATTNRKVAGILTDVGVSVAKLCIGNETCNIKCLSLIGSLLTNSRICFRVYRARAHDRDEAKRNRGGTAKTKCEVARRRRSARWHG